MLPPESALKIGNFYLAPYEGYYYRAELKSIDGLDCHIVFIDFGNEADLPIAELKQLPPEITSDVNLTFKVMDMDIIMNIYLLIIFSF